VGKRKIWLTEASDPGTVEIFERTSAGRFVVAKRTRPAPPFHSCTSSEDETTGGRKGEERGEMFMLVGKKDASLTDAERECDLLDVRDR
jgi:hypothetical protein